MSCAEADGRVYQHYKGCLPPQILRLSTNISALSKVFRRAPRATWVGICTPGVGRRTRVKTLVKTIGQKPTPLHPSCAQGRLASEDRGSASVKKAVAEKRVFTKTAFFFKKVVQKCCTRPSAVLSKILGALGFRPATPTCR